MKIKINLIILFFCSIAIGCNQGPKVISAPEQSSNNQSSESTGIFANGNPQSEATLPKLSTNDVHTIIILEVLPTSKYVYLRVNENKEEYWIATGKKDVNIGESYFFKNAILKTNFESKEHNRIFKKVYLVSNLVPANHGENPEASISQAQPEERPESNLEIIEKKGSIKIADIVSNPQKYAGQTVQVSGKCTKVNPNIMGRNWIHLKDGSQDEFDMVVTSDQVVPEGHVVTMSGIVTLQKDFGAGYKYDIIIENGQIVK